MDRLSFQRVRESTFIEALYLLNFELFRHC